MASKTEELSRRLRMGGRIFVVAFEGYYQMRELDWRLKSAADRDLTYW